MALSAFEQASPRVLAKRGLRVCSCKEGMGVGVGEKREKENSARNLGTCSTPPLPGRRLRLGAALQDERRAPATATTCAELRENRGREDPPPRDPGDRIELEPGPSALCFSTKPRVNNAPGPRLQRLA